MIRKAESIFKEHRIKLGPRHYINKEDFIRCINEARAEVVKECASRVDHFADGTIKSSVLSVLKKIK